MLFSLYLLPFVHGSVLLQVYYSIFNCYHGAFADKKKKVAVFGLECGRNFYLYLQDLIKLLGSPTKQQIKIQLTQHFLNLHRNDITFQLSIDFPGQTSEPAICTLQKALRLKCGYFHAAAVGRLRGVL